jgi:hypothetical protein
LSDSHDHKLDDRPARKLVLSGERPARLLRSYRISRSGFAQVISSLTARANFGTVCSSDFTTSSAES